MYKISTCAVCINSKHPISKFDNSKIAAAVLVSFAAAQAGITQCSLPPLPCPWAWRDSGWEGDYSSLSRRSFRSCSRLLQSIGRQSVYGWLTDHQHILSQDNCWYLIWLSFHKSANSRPIQWLLCWLIHDWNVGQCMKIACDLVTDQSVVSNRVHHVSVDRYQETKGKALG